MGEEGGYVVERAGGEGWMEGRVRRIAVERGLVGEGSGVEGRGSGRGRSEL